MHHVLHTAATLESNGYYGDYKDDTEKFSRALAEGFAFQGEVMQARNASRGEPSAKPSGTVMRPWSVCWTLQGSEENGAYATSF